MGSAPISYADRIAATGQLLKGGGALGKLRVRHIIVSPSGAGSFIFRDGGAAGTVKIPQVDIAGAGQPFDIAIPDEGVFFGTDVHITIVACALVVGYG